jgi:hypothetical protein
MPAGPEPEYGVYLLGKQPTSVPWDSRWIRWPDFRLPAEPVVVVFREALRRAGTERVEFACGGGRGRTGTALACLAVLDGVPASRAVEYVREKYDRHAVETPWQKRFVRGSSAPKPVDAEEPGGVGSAVCGSSERIQTGCMRRLGITM